MLYTDNDACFLEEMAEAVPFVQQPYPAYNPYGKTEERKTEAESPERKNMITIKFDMPFPKSCNECLFEDGPCATCYADIPKQRSTYPYCKELQYWSSYELEHYNKFKLKPDWCPMKEVKK